MAGARMMEPALKDRYPEELEAAAQQVAMRLGELGVMADDAARMAWEIAEHLRRFWGGRQTYIRAPHDRADSAQLDLLGDDAGTVPDCELLADLADQVEERLVAIGTAHDTATALGLRVAQHMNAFWGGGQLYICKGERYEISLRDQEIFRRFSNQNYDWLAQEYNLTVQHVYRVVKRVGAAERAKRQAVLFEA